MRRFEIVRRSKASGLLAIGKQMSAGAIGPLLGFVVLFALPLAGAVMLPAEEFAMWALLSTVLTISLSIDFGGVALTMSRIGLEPRRPLVLRAIGLSSLGALIVGVIALIVWVPYSGSASAVAYSFREGCAAIVLACFSAVLRGALMVIAQVALNDHRFGIRTVISVGQSLLTAVFGVGALFVWRTAWALPAAWVASCLVVGAIMIPISVRAGMFRTPESVSDAPRYDGHAAFAGGRTVVAILGAIMQQADRWVVGLIGGPALLAAYEVAWRFATMPRYLIQNLAAVLGGNAVRVSAESGQGVIDLLRRGTVVSAIAGGVGSLACGLAYFLWTDWTSTPQLIVVFFGLLGAQLLMGLSAPLSVVTLGMGMPKLDIPYMAISAAFVFLFALWALLSGEVQIFIFGNIAAMGGGVCWFFWYGPRTLRRRLGLSG